VSEATDDVGEQVVSNLACDGFGSDVRCETVLDYRPAHNGCCSIVSGLDFLDRLSPVLPRLRSIEFFFSSHHPTPMGLARPNLLVLGDSGTDLFWRSKNKSVPVFINLD